MNKKKMIASAVIIALIMISFISGSTFAKYRTSYKASASMEVAKWAVTESFLVNGRSSTSKNITLATTYSEDTLVDGKIAPGTVGSFGVKIDATGTETGVDYEVIFDNVSGTKPQNLLFVYEDYFYSDFETLSEALKGNITANASDKILNLEINWYWPYETTMLEGTEYADSLDTSDRKNSF